MSFTQFIKPYPDGYEDFEVGGTPVTAEILNNNYDGFLLGLNEFLPELAGMVEANPSESATAGNLTKLKVGNSIYLIPSGGSGGSTVVWEQLQLTGTKIATITIDNVPVDVYAPSGGSGDEVSWTQEVSSGTKIGTITINDTPIDVYAPTPIDVEANPSGSATAGDLTKLKVGSGIYSIPSGGSGGSGHTILDDDGTALAQEDDLQFKGVYSADNSEDGVTEVNVYREMTKSEFNLLSSDEKKGFIRVIDEPDIYSDGHFQPVIYSTEEREIGVWEDGKPLYQKTWVFTSGLAVSYNSWTASIIDSTDIENIVNVEAIHNDGSCFDGIMADPTNANHTKVAFQTTRNNASAEIKKLTLQYTKISDTAGSGSWTPQGVPTHKYSTEEHIVGTWIDGKTLYEKTINFGALPNASTKDVAHNISNLDNIWIQEGFCHSSSGTFTLPVYYSMDKNSTPPAPNGFTFSVNSTNIRALTYTDRSAFTECYITIRYTKSS